MRARSEVEAELRAIDAGEQIGVWAAKELERYDNTEKRRLLAYLATWVKAQPGHGRDCDCGECD